MTRSPPLSLTNSQRVARSRAKAIDGGAIQLNIMLRDPEARKALELLAAECGTRRAAVEHALKVAAKNSKKRKKC